MNRFLIILVCLLSLSGTGSVMAQDRAAKVKISTTMTEIDGVRFAVHSVARREKVGDIAAAYGVSVSDIVEYNPEARNALRFRSSLLIPLGSPIESVESEIVIEEVVVIDPEVRDSLMLDSLSREVFSLGQIGLVSVAKPLKIKLLLPLQLDNSSRKGFVEFYNGFLLGLEDFGCGMELDVISTDRTAETIEELILDSTLLDANVIVGPIYPEEIAALAPWAAAHHIPVISPLAASLESLNPYVVEVAPSARFQWDGVKDMLRDDSVNVIVINHATKTNQDALLAVEDALSPMAHRVDYVNKATNVNVLKNPLSKSLPNIIFLPLDSELAVEEVLTRYSSLNAQGYYDISIVGTPQWARFTKVNMELFYKLNVSYPTSYFYDRMTRPASEVVGHYISKYSMLPSLFVMRGYDVAKIVVGGIETAQENLLYELLRDSHTPVQTPYHFELFDDHSKIENTKWPLVHHNKNFTVEVR